MSIKVYIENCSLGFNLQNTIIITEGYILKMKEEKNIASEMPVHQSLGK